MDPAVEGTKKLLNGRPENRLVGLVGPTWTTNCRHAARIATDAMVPIVSSGSNYPFLADKGTEYQYLLRSTFSLVTPLQMLCKFLQERGWHDIATVAYVNDPGASALNYEAPFQIRQLQEHNIRNDMFPVHVVWIDAPGVCAESHLDAAKAGSKTGTVSYHPGCRGSTCLTDFTEGTDRGNECFSKTEGEQAYNRELLSTLKSIRTHGFRVIHLDVFTDEAHPYAQDLWDRATEAGMLQGEYTWVSRELSVRYAGSPWMSHDGFIYVAPHEETVTTTTEFAKKHQERWSEITKSLPSTFDDIIASDVFDHVSGYPLYTAYTTKDGVQGDVWDLSASGGGKLTDAYGLYTYDTVWIYAHAIDALIKKGVSPYDGSALRAELLSTHFKEMVSGPPYSFHPEFQDRLKSSNVYEVRDGGAMHAMLMRQYANYSAVSIEYPIHADASATSCTAASLKAGTLAEGCIKLNDTDFVDFFPGGTFCGNGLVTEDVVLYDGVVTCTSAANGGNSSSSSGTSGDAAVALQRSNATLVAAVASACAVVVALLIISAVLWTKNESSAIDFKAMMQDKQHELREDEGVVDDYPDVREIPRKRVNITQQVGAGNFGEVWRGVLNDVDPATGKPKPSVHVAVKLVNAKKTVLGLQEERNLIEEAALMAMITSPHQNVVQLIGVVTRKLPKMVVMEFCDNGPLKEYVLQKRALLTCNKKLQISVDICSGMAHLISYKIIHRDLAARNILVDVDGTCKVADFGTSRKGVDLDDGGGGAVTYERSEDSKTELAWRWMAPETSLTQKYTQQTDVWSFGMCMWEVWSDGANPFPERNSAEVLSWIRLGHRPMKPNSYYGACPKNIYVVMRDCWEKEAAHRPTFNELKATLSRLLAQPRSAVAENQRSGTRAHSTAAALRDGSVLLEGDSYNSYDDDDYVATDVPRRSRKKSLESIISPEAVEASRLDSDGYTTVLAVAPLPPLLPQVHGAPPPSDTLFSTPAAITAPTAATGATETSTLYGSYPESRVRRNQVAPL